MDDDEYLVFAGNFTYVLLEEDGRFWVEQVNSETIPGVVVGFTDESAALTEREGERVIRALLYNDNVRGRYMHWITRKYDEQLRMAGTRDLDPGMVIVTPKVQRLQKKYVHSGRQQARVDIPTYRKAS